MTAYYNELDPEKAEWLRQLILAKVVAPGDVDERSISDVRPDDLRGYTQCHFFAGIGVWSYALRLAGWPDDREVWTGSCPCPSFSCAGKGEGFDDPRHLWPEWYRLIRQCRPGTVFGEQVNAAIGHGWLDLVCGDVEAEGYAIATAVLGAHSAGAPHIRQRLYFVADSDSERFTLGQEQNGSAIKSRQQAPRRRDVSGCGGSGECADTELSNRRTELEIDSDTHGRNGLGRSSDTLSGPNSERNGRRSDLTLRETQGRTADGRDSATSRQEGQSGITLDSGNRGDRGIRDYARESGATRGFWADCDWWHGRDGKYRPIESGVQPLAHGITGRVLKLRGYGDAICAETAKVFIESYLQVYRPQST